MRIKTIAEHEATGSVKIEYDRLIEKFGIVPNMTKAFSILPGIFDLHNDMYRKIMVENSLLPKPIKQILAVMASGAAKCGYCRFWHTRFLMLMGVDEKIIQALGSDFRQAPVDEKTKSLMEFADRVVHDPTGLLDKDLQELRDQGFADEEILEATVVLGYFGFLTRVVDTLGIEIESPETPLETEETSPETEK